MGDPEWAQLDMFDDMVVRGQNKDLIYSLVGDWAMQRGKMEIMDCAQAEGAPVTAVLTVEEAAELAGLPPREAVERAHGAVVEDVDGNRLLDFASGYYQRELGELALAVLPAVVLFVIWDLYAIGAGHWYFDARRMLGVVFAGGLPLEELLFFLVIPVAGILTLEAVRSATGWRVGDEPPGDPAGGTGQPGDPARGPGQSA